MTWLHGRKGRNSRWTIVVLAVAIAVIVPFAVPSFAVLAGSTFEGNDGNLTRNTTGNIDWCSLTAAQLAALAAPNTNKCPTANEAPNLAKGIDTPSGSATDNAFSNGTKQDDINPTIGTGGIPPSKDDLSRFYIAYESIPISGVANTFVYLAWERNSPNGASAHEGFEFNKLRCPPDCSDNGVTPDRSVGDLLIVYDFEGGDDAPTISTRRWVTSAGATCEVSQNSPPCWGTKTTLGANQAEALTNAASVIDPINPNAPRTQIANAFGEAAVNLTAANVLDPSNCEGFGSAMVVSRSSGNSANSTMKDFIAPVPITINNCGTVVINKTGVGGGPLAGATFTIFNDLAPVGGSRNAGGVTDTSTGKSCTTNASGTCSIANVNFGNYWLVETTTPPGYVTLADISFAVVSAGQVITFNLSNNPAPGTINIHKQDDDNPPVPLAGAVFQLFTDASPFGPASPGGGSQTAHGAEDTAVAGKTCTTNASGDCSITGVALGRYWVVETTPPPGHAPAPDQNVVIGIGSSPNTGVTVNLTFTNPRLFKVIVIVCKKAGNSLYASQVSFDGAALPGAPNSLGTGGGGSLTDAQVCGLGGAVHDNVPRGAHSASVNIPQ